MMFGYATLALGIALANLAHADPLQEIGAINTAFVAAQNRHEIDADCPPLSERPNVLWISNRRPFCGSKAMLARVAELQEAEVWRVEPDFAASQVILLKEGTAVFPLPLRLSRSKAGPACMGLAPLRFS
jgi:hypothetical protein